MVNNAQLIEVSNALDKITDPDTMRQALHIFNLRQRYLQSLGAMAFRVGQRVEFDARTRGIVKGVIQKINTKSIKVLADSGMRWNVSPMFLKVIK